MGVDGGFEILCGLQAFQNGRVRVAVYLFLHKSNEMLAKIVKIIWVSFFAELKIKC